MKFTKIYFSDFLSERKEFFEPDDKKIQDLTKIEKIDFSKGQLHLGKYKPTKTKQIIVEPNDFVFSGLNIEKGAVSINETGLRLVVSANYSTCKVNFDIIDKEFLSYLIKSKYFKSILLDNLKKDYGFTRPKHLMPLSFIAPSSIDDQRRIVEELRSTEVDGLDLSLELANQIKIIKKLRQQILQEAIDGKLTAGWRDVNRNVEPASELLNRIRMKRNEVKKRKNDKISELIDDAEKTLELPSGWVWCRIGHIAETKVGATPSTTQLDYWDGDVNWVSSGEVANCRIFQASTKITQKAVAETSAKVNPKGSVLVAMIGQGKTRGQVAVLDIDAATNQNVCAIRLFDGVIPEFIYYFFLSRYEKTRSGASGGNQPALNGIKIANTVVALPPREEMIKIVEKIKNFEIMLNGLEEQISQNVIHADGLMQTVLNEVFIRAVQSE